MRPIGRERECSRLIEHLDGLSDGTGAVVLLEGEGGTGKTTLATWLLDEARTRGMTTMSGRSWERSQSVPHEPIVAAVGRFLRTLAPQAKSELVAGLRSLGQLFDGLEQPAASPNRARLHDALATMFARLAEDRPVVLHIDDLHWTDVASLEALQFLCGDLPYVRMMLLATVRPADADRRPEVRTLVSSLRRADVTHSIAVRSVDYAETAAIVRARLPGPLPDHLVELIWSRSAGTPLVVHELIDDFLDRGILVDDAPGWRLTEHDPSPPRVLGELIADRLDQLPPNPRRILEVLAVADDALGLDVLGRVTGIAADDIGAALTILTSRRLVDEQTDRFGAVEWLPEHPIISGVVATRLDELVRQRVHRQLLEADPEASLARKARHVIGAGAPEDPEAAMAMLIRAADEAALNGAPTEAIAMATAAEQLLAELSATADLDELQSELDLRIGAWQLRMYDGAAAIERLSRAWDGFFERGDGGQAVRAHRELDRASFFHGGTSPDALADRYERLLSHLQDHGNLDAELELRLVDVQALSRDDPGNPAQAGRAAAFAELAETIGTDAARAMATVVLSWNRWASTNGSDAADEIAQMRAIVGSTVPWTHRYRAALSAVERAGVLGRTTLLDECLEELRAVERETGEGANWRHALLRGWAEVHRDGSTEAGDALLLAGQVTRATALSGLLRACAVRYQRGPIDALAAFDDAVAPLHSPGLVASVNIVIGRAYLARGHADERTYASAAVAVGEESLAAFDLSTAQGGVFGGAWLRALTLAGSDHAVSYRRDLEELSAGQGALMAAVHDADALTASTERERCDHLLDAAELLRENGFDLIAAERIVEVAECRPEWAGSERLQWAATVLSGRSPWLAARLEACGASVGTALDAAGHDAILTRRELEVAVEVAKGLTNREVAAELFISIRTVTSHLDHIYTKLAISSRGELADYVARSSHRGST